MANHRRDDIRKDIQRLKKKHPTMSLVKIAKKVGLPGRQWVYYYLKQAPDVKDKEDERWEGREGNS